MEKLQLIYHCLSNAFTSSTSITCNTLFISFFLHERTHPFRLISISCQKMYTATKVLYLTPSSKFLPQRLDIISILGKDKHIVHTTDDDYRSSYKNGGVASSSSSSLVCLKLSNKTWFCNLAASFKPYKLLLTFRISSILSMLG